MKILPRNFIAPNEPTDSAKWRASHLDYCKEFSGHLWREWQRIYAEKGYVVANLYLVKIKPQLKLGSTGLKVNATDAKIDNYAKYKSKQIQRDNMEWLSRMPSKQDAVREIKARFEQIGIPFPLKDKYWKKDFNKSKVIAALARTADHLWLRKQLKKVAIRQLEQLHREFSMVSKDRDSYLSNANFLRIMARKKANEKLLESLVATNELDQSYTLADLQKLSVSNPALRRTELMVRCAGFEEWSPGDAREWEPYFLTLTAPSKYHPTTTRNKTVFKNKKYTGYTPKQTQDYLNKCWQRIRASLARSRCQYFGFRVTEPHHDGTPHWHLLFFIEKTSVDTLCATFTRYALQEDGNERGAKQQRCDIIYLDPNKGRATGYIAKYISKNVDGYKIDIDDESGTKADKAAIRVSCWASLWGIRQFQQIGGPPVTVYRQCRQHDISNSKLTKLLSDVVNAADGGHWAEYTSLMGGSITKRCDRPIRPH